MDTAPFPCAQGIPLDAETGIGALTLGGYLREICECYGPREAAVLREGQGVMRWTYRDLWDHSVDVARALIAGGLGQGSRVGILMTNRLEFLSAFFGTALAGGVATPISTFSTPNELDEVLQTSNCSVLLFERHVVKKDFATILRDLEPAIDASGPGALFSTRYPWLRRIASVGEAGSDGAIEEWNTFLASGNLVPSGIVDATSRAVRPSDPGTLFFSSGSTGKAKGILSAHRGPCLQLWRWPQWYGFDEPPRTWSSNGFFFSGNFSQALGGTLTSGGTLILQRWFAAEDAIELMEREGASMLLAWPHQWAQLEAAPGYLDADLSSLKYIDATTPIARHPTISTSWREPFHAYGCTETFTLISVYPGATPASEIAGSHGLPTPGTTIRIVNPISGMPLPVGVRGEIAVKGPTLMLGYVGTPTDQTLDADGFYRTGDSGHIDAAGRLFWEGRLNDIIKTGGANVSPLEIDQVIRAMPGVKICQTVGVPDDLLGELVVSCIVRHHGSPLDEEQVRSAAREKLASFKVPRRVIFLEEDQIGTTGSAKIKTKDLRALAANALALKTLS